MMMNTGTPAQPLDTRTARDRVPTPLAATLAACLLAFTAGCDRGADEGDNLGGVGSSSSVAEGVPAATLPGDEVPPGGPPAPDAITATPPGASADRAVQGSTGQGPTVRAVAELQSKSGSNVTGTIQLAETEGRLVADVLVRGLEPNSVHGFHVHETGDCSAPDASSAGGHFAPEGNQHGRPGGTNYHAGDLPNLEANAQGIARVELPMPRLTLASGQLSIAGRAFVVHAGPDDYTTQPAGDSGPRLACGEIVLQ